MSIPPENPHAYPTAPPPVVMGQPYQAQQQPPPQQQQQQASSPKPAVYTQPPPAMIYMPCFGDDPVHGYVFFWYSSSSGHLHGCRVVLILPVVFHNSPPVVVVTHEFGHDPMVVTCPRCHCKVITSVSHDITCGTWICSGIICVFCIFLFWLPFLIKQCQEARHTCPNCGFEIGKKVFITS
ncbi:hypothetical protein FOL47_009899 [Perkinsus chesapeaki]|uniref:LITAF domain-containing protein n=1 Tax=Perkinsus chesapeaki TaxID=330153 RepID=A0A7J6MSQ9_PERCH|nr:hypothetical protein FOL47_009899 [Perkinsus chesapeaki]